MDLIKRTDSEESLHERVLPFNPQPQAQQLHDAPPAKVLKFPLRAAQTLQARLDVPQENPDTMIWDMNDG